MQLRLTRKAQAEMEERFELQREAEELLSPSGKQTRKAYSALTCV